VPVFSIVNMRRTLLVSKNSDSDPIRILQVRVALRSRELALVGYARTPVLRPMTDVFDGASS
jgi:hypothetical protein